MSETKPAATLPKKMDETNAIKPKLDLTCATLTLPVAPRGASYYTHKQGDNYTVKGGKSKGEIRQQRTSKMAVLPVAKLQAAGVKDAASVAKRMSLDLKHQAAKLMLDWDKDDRIGVRSIIASVKNDGMVAAQVNYVQFTSAKLYASLLAHGLTPAQAQKVCDQYPDAAK